MKTERAWRTLTSADDVTDAILAHVDECLDWFEGEPLRTEEFIDRFCKSYGGDGWGDGDWDLDRYDSPAAQKIMRHARKTRREREAWS